MPEAWLAFPAFLELLSRLIAEDAELLWVVRGRPVARAEAEVSAPPGLWEAQSAPARASASHAQVGPVRAFAEPKAAQSEE